MPDPVLKRALRELPSRLATTIYLADAKGYTYAEIARITGVPIGTVMSRLHRARKRLRARLADSALRKERPAEEVIRLFEKRRRPVPNPHVSQFQGK
jgi:RNA polymerase sigma-70 factor (ECF subfamily)